MPELEYYPKKDCKVGYLYKVFARNFSEAIWNGVTFIGIRQKFGDRYLDFESHWDDGVPYGTVKPEEELEKVPEGIELRMNLGIEDFTTRRKVYFSNNAPHYTNNDESVPIGTDIRIIDNIALFEYLDGV